MKKSKFNLTHERQITMKPDGTLYPIMCERVLPGELWRGNHQMFGRMIPLLYPVYHRFDLFVKAFFVPDRLVWDNFRKFVSPEYTGDRPDEHPNFPAFVPSNLSQLQTLGIDQPVHAPISRMYPNSLADLLGYQFGYSESNPWPIDDLTLSGLSSQQYFSSLPFRAYQLVWNEHIRDIDLDSPIPVAKTDGYNNDNEEVQFSFLKACVEKDYFTSARPYPQKGAEIEAAVPIVGATLDDPEGGGAEVQGSFSLKDLRWANAVQVLYEKLMRRGSRYPEYLKSVFGVNYSDARIDRPEYIGGGRQPFVVSEVLQTSQSEVSPLGTFGGHAVTVGASDWKYKVEEHGMVMVLAYILPRSKYLNTVRKQWIVSDAGGNNLEDYVIPEFAGLGNQEVKNVELNGKLQATFNPDGTFGYQERYAHLKFIPSTVHGLFRTDANLLNFHAARLNMESAVLSDEFVHLHPDDDINRIFAVDDTDPILMSVINRVEAVRPLPRISIPHL